MQKKFSICPPYHRWARKNFEMRGAVTMKNNLNKARQRKIKPNWIGDSTWDTLCQQWASEEFQKKSTIAKINKVFGCGGFGGSRHTCGSISTYQHKYNMVICFSNYFLFITSQYIYIYNMESV